MQYFYHDYQFCVSFRCELHTSGLASVPMIGIFSRSTHHGSSYNNGTLYLYINIHVVTNVAGGYLGVGIVCSDSTYANLVKRHTRGRLQHCSKNSLFHHVKLQPEWKLNTGMLE